MEQTTLRNNPQQLFRRVTTPSFYHFDIEEIMASMSKTPQEPQEHDHQHNSGSFCVLGIDSEGNCIGNAHSDLFDGLYIGDYIGLASLAVILISMIAAVFWKVSDYFLSKHNMLDEEHEENLRKHFVREGKFEVARKIKADRIQRHLSQESKTSSWSICFGLLTREKKAPSKHHHRRRVSKPRVYVVQPPVSSNGKKVASDDLSIMSETKPDDSFEAPMRKSRTHEDMRSESRNNSPVPSLAAALARQRLNTGESGRMSIRSMPDKSLLATHHLDLKRKALSNTYRKNQQQRPSFSRYYHNPALETASVPLVMKANELLQRTANNNLEREIDEEHNEMMDFEHNSKISISDRGVARNQLIFGDGDDFGEESLDDDSDQYQRGGLYPKQQGSIGKSSIHSSYNRLPHPYDDSIEMV